MLESCCQQVLSERRTKPYLQLTWASLLLHGQGQRRHMVTAEGKSPSDTAETATPTAEPCRESMVFTQVETGSQSTDSGSTHRSAQWKLGDLNQLRSAHHSMPRPFILSSLPSHPLLSLPTPSLARSFCLTHHVVSTQSWLNVYGTCAATQGLVLIRAPHLA